MNGPLGHYAKSDKDKYMITFICRFWSSWTHEIKTESRRMHTRERRVGEIGKYCVSAAHSLLMNKCWDQILSKGSNVYTLQSCLETRSEVFLPPKQKESCDMLVVLAHTKVKILLCRVSDQHIVYLKLTQCCMVIYLNKNK